MFYLSSKPFFVYMQEDENEGMVVEGRAEQFRELLPIEIAMSDGHLISKH
jgi:hypothetical protein